MTVHSLIFLQKTEVTATLADEKLFQAIICCDIEKVQKALGNGADVNARSDWGLTPLHVAARVCFLSHTPDAPKIVKLLLSEGADASLRDGFHKLAAAWAETNCPPCLREHMQELAAQGVFPAPNPDGHYESEGLAA